MASTLNYANTLSPKTARSGLVPSDATNVPAPIAEANEAAAQTVEACRHCAYCVGQGLASWTVKAAYWGRSPGVNA
jgi:hypothetical protein